MNAIVPPPESHQQFRRPVQLAALAEFLSDQEIETICRHLGHTWRNRIFPPGTTVRSLVYRSLHPKRSIESILADLAADTDWCASPPAAASWCEARNRLPQAIWTQLLAHSVGRLVELAGTCGTYCGRPVYLIDGSSVSMPDEPELVRAFGYADTKHGPSRFPVARVTLMVRPGAEAVCDYRLGPYRESEDAQLHAMWQSIPDGAICVFDRFFSSFYNLAKLPQRGIDVVSRLHQRRDPGKLIRNGRKAGPNEWIVTFTLWPQLRRQYDDPSLPKSLPVRLIRVPVRRRGRRKQLWLVTTLLDPQGHCRAQIVNLYRGRWQVETRIGSLKTTLQMNVLRSRTLKGVRHEVAATIVAHNLLWTVIHQAATKTKTPPARISFAGAMTAVLAFSGPLRNSDSTERRAVYKRMLDCIGRRVNPWRPGRIEPRLIKRDSRRYGYLKVPRDKARKEGLS